MSPRLRTLAPFAALAALAGAASPSRHDLPPIVYVSRAPAPDGQVPGLGPGGAAMRGHGRLMRLEPDGRARALLPAGTLLDAQDPDVSPDGRSIVFSGLAAGDDGWRLWVVGVDGGPPRPVPASRRASGPVDSTWDDVDPCWVNEQIVFVRLSGEFGRAPYDGRPTGALRVADTAAATSALLVAERGGALDPCVDAGLGRLLYARWWFNPWRPGADGRPIRAGAGPDTVNQWQIVSARPTSWPLAATGVGRAPGVWDVRLAAGGVDDRRSGMGVQPSVLARGGIAAVYAANTGLAPRPGPVGVHVLGPAPGAGRRLAGAALAPGDAHPYREGRNLAASGACAPAGLPDGALVLAFDPGGRGDYGLWRVALDGTRTRLVDEPGWLELDPAPVVRRSRVAPRGPWPDASADPRFVYENRDVFAGRGAPARVPGAVLRVWTESPSGALESTDVPVAARGAVRARLDARAALFEQLVAPDGRVLSTPHGPAQVRGFNTGHPGARSTCRGCHLGHSARP